MTREEAIKYGIEWLKDEYLDAKDRAFIKIAIKALEKEPCEDCVSRQAVLALPRNKDRDFKTMEVVSETINVADIETLSPVNPKQRTGYCKDCKYFDYDSVAKVDGVPLIVAHKICSRWGNGCKTKEDGYCFLFEPQESEAE